MTFRTGQKVVYVGAKISIWRQIERALHPYVTPQKDVVYTVANTYATPCGVLMIELLELPSPADDYWSAGFNSCVFRPVVDRKTDIGFAHEILRKASKTKETVASGRARDRATCSAVARFNEGRAA
jgi:hypothetical protein